MSDGFNDVPAELIEAEMERILAQDHGHEGVRVSFDRDLMVVTCSRELPDDLKGRVFALAVKQAVIRYVRDQQSGD